MRTSRCIQLLLLLAIFVPLAGTAAQTKPGTRPGPPFKPNPSLSQQEKQGQYLFFQRCSLCHLPQYTKTSDYSDLPPVFFNLNGLFKDGNEDTEKTARAYILSGGGRMPGFRYGLKPEEIDSLIAYLKTLSK